MAVIVTIIVIMALVLLGWMWSSLGNIEIKTKIACIVGSVIFVYILTFIIYNVSKIGIVYENEQAMKIIRVAFVIVFTILNGYIILPYFFRNLEKINNDEKEKEKFIKSIVILLIIIVVLFIFESIYLGNMQQGILKMNQG